MFLLPPATRYDWTFCLGRIPVRGYPGGWLVAALLGWQGNASLLEILIWTDCLFLSLLAHEMGHALMARRFGGRQVRIFFFWVGGATTYQGTLTARERVIQNLAGPLSGLLLAGIVLVLSFLTGWERDPGIAGYAARILIFVNLFWSLLNLAQVLPLDGGLLLKEWCQARRFWDAHDRAQCLSFWFVVGITGIAFFFSIFL